jgi:integrase
MTRLGDGIKDLGKDRAGKRWWLARLYWVDQRTGKERETKRRIEAPSKGKALIKRDELLEKLRGGKPTKDSERKRFREVADEWLATITVAATRITATSMVRKLNAKFGDWWMDAVATESMQEWLDSLTIKSVNNVRSHLINVFRHAKKKGYVPENLASKTERRKEERAPVIVDDDVEDDMEDEEEDARSLTPEQLAAYFDDLEKNEKEVYPLVFISFMLGCRFAEVSALRRDRVDLESGIVRIRRGQYRGHLGRTKGKRGRKVALPLEARALLKAHLDRMEREKWPGWDQVCFPRPPARSKPGSPVFWASSTVDAAIRRSFKRCGIEVKGTTHVARHTMITAAQELTASEALLRKVVGHRSKKVHQGYVHPADAKVIQLGDAVGRELLKGRKREG